MSYDVEGTLVMYFLVNASPKPLEVATSNFAGTYVILGKILCDHDPNVKVSDEKVGICDSVSLTAFRVILTPRSSSKIKYCVFLSLHLLLNRLTEQLQTCRCMGYITSRYWATFLCPGQMSNNAFSCNCISSRNVECSRLKLCRCIGHIM